MVGHSFSGEYFQVAPPSEIRLLQSPDSALELKRLVNELKNEIAKAGKEEPREALEEITKSLAILDAELSGQKPNKDLLKLSHRGLVEASKMVGEIFSSAIVKVASELLRRIS